MIEGSFELISLSVIRRFCLSGLVVAGSAS
jgi:hypothetical protein